MVRGRLNLKSLTLVDVKLASFIYEMFRYTLSDVTVTENGLAGGDNLQFLPEGVRRECRIRLKYRPLFALMALPLPTTGCRVCRGRRETNWMLKNDPHPDKSF